MAKATDESQWLQTSLLASGIYNQIRDPKVKLFPYEMRDFFPWPKQIPEPLVEKVKPSQLFTGK